MIAGSGWLAVMLVAGACAQTSGNAMAPLDSKGEVLRQIEDPSTGDLWLLFRDANRPGGPGRLLLARQRSSGQRAAFGGPAQPSTAGERLVVRAGDSLLVEEHTAMVDTRLEAVALESAAKGARFKARLKIGGKVVCAIAISPGRAGFAPESEVAP